MGKKNKNQNRTGFWEIFASVYFSNGISLPEVLCLPS